MPIKWNDPHTYKSGTSASFVSMRLSKIKLRICRWSEYTLKSKRYNNSASTKINQSKLHKRGYSNALVTNVKSKKKLISVSWSIVATTFEFFFSLKPIELTISRASHQLRSHRIDFNWIIKYLPVLSVTYTITTTLVYLYRVRLSSTAKAHTHTHTRCNLLVSNYKHIFFCFISNKLNDLLCGDHSFIFIFNKSWRMRGARASNFREKVFFFLTKKKIRFYLFLQFFERFVWVDFSLFLLQDEFKSFKRNKTIIFVIINRINVGFSL